MPDLVQPRSNGAAAHLYSDGLQVNEYLDVECDYCLHPRKHISLAPLPSAFPTPWQPKMGVSCPMEWELMFVGNHFVRFLKLPC